MRARDRSARDDTNAARAKVVARFRRLCLALPETSEKAFWGHPRFCVRGNSSPSTRSTAVAHASRSSSSTLIKRHCSAIRASIARRTSATDFLSRLAALVPRPRAGPGAARARARRVARDPRSRLESVPSGVRDRSAAFRTCGKRDEGLATIACVIELDSEDPFAYTRQSIFLQRKGLFPEAEAAGLPLRRAAADQLREGRRRLRFGVSGLGPAG